MTLLNIHESGRFLYTASVKMATAPGTESDSSSDEDTPLIREVIKKLREERRRKKNDEESDVSLSSDVDIISSTGRCMRDLERHARC